GRPGDVTQHGLRCGHCCRRGKIVGPRRIVERLGRVFADLLRVFLVDGLFRIADLNLRQDELGDGYRPKREENYSTDYLPHHRLLLLASGPPSRSMRYAASRPPHSRPVPTLFKYSFFAEAIWV